MIFRVHYVVVTWLVIAMPEILCDGGEDNWEEPNAWSREHAISTVSGDGVKLASGQACPKGEPAVCFDRATPVVTDNVLAFNYYKKFIANLFNRKKLQYDTSATLYKRSVIFTILPAQLEQLEKLNDPRDLDSVLTEIFANARNVDNSHSTNDSIFVLLFEFFKDLTALLKISEVRFVLLGAATILLGWFLHRRYGVGIVCIIAVGLIGFGYFYTYIQCNKQLVVEEMLEVMQQNERIAKVESSWWTPVKAFFGYESELQQITIDRLRKSSKINLGYCRPDHVLLMYTNEVFFKQLEILLETCTVTLTTLKNKLSFPYNYFAVIMLFFMIGYCVKLTFKYILSPRAWASLYHRSSATAQPVHGANQESNSRAEVLSGDLISGKNLTLLLNVLNETINTGKTPPIASGIDKLNGEPEANAENPSVVETSEWKSPLQQLKLKNNPENNDKENAIHDTNWEFLMAATESESTQ